MLTARQHINIFAVLQLHRIKTALSYQTNPELHSLSRASGSNSAVTERSVQGRGPAHVATPQHAAHGKSADVRATRLQQHRANSREHIPVHWREDCELTPAQLKKRQKNAAYRAKKLQQQALQLEGES